MCNIPKYIIALTILIIAVKDATVRHYKFVL